MRRFDKLLGFAAVFAVAVAVSACNEGSGDVVSTSEMPTLTFQVNAAGQLGVAPSDNFRRGVYPFRLRMLDEHGKVLHEKVRTEPRIIEPPTPEQEEEMRAALNSEAGRRFLELVSGS